MHGWAMNIDELTNANTNFLEVIHTGEYSQVTIMSIEPGDDIGTHRHPRIDQLVRAESGSGRVTLGSKRDRMEEIHELERGWAAFVPAGAWHNIINTGSVALKIQLVHSPAKRWRDDAYATRAEAIAADEEMDREVTIGMAGADGFGA
ncbi:MAG: cupin domain-containing protein [Thermoleophilia bacterium]|nr:cupin domain-containing protein [Thermoleophilia bacterium]